jgi:hypothetical protein
MPISCWASYVAKAISVRARVAIVLKEDNKNTHSAKVVVTIRLGQSQPSEHQ